MKPKLFFGLSLDFDLTTNEQLKEMSVLKFWDRGLQKYVYIFQAETLDKLIALIGKEIDFENQKLELLNFIQYAPSLKKEINIERWKGKGYLYIQRFPKLFIIKTIINKKQQTFKIPLATVKACWRAIKKINKGFQKKSKELAEGWCKKLNNLIRHYESQCTLSKYGYCIRCEEELLQNLKQVWREKECEI